jgi:carboxypeptidase Taq
MRRERDRAIATPLSLVMRIARATAVAEVRWLEAKQESNFALFAPHLEEVVALTRDKAQVLSQALGLEPYDALIDGFSPGFLSAEIDQLFRVVSQRLPGLIRDAIELQAGRPPLPIQGKVSSSKQRSLAVEVMRALGFPFDRGRLDESDHPFTEGVSGDVRVTTRFVPQEPFTGLMGVLHETGTGDVRPGPPRGLARPAGGTRSRHGARGEPVAAARDDHRSQPGVPDLPAAAARETLRRRRARVGNREPLPDADPVRRGAIRADADELTYPVHIMLRFELEKRILDGTLPVRDLPAAWSEGLEGRLGLRPASDAEGCLQDVHWAVGSFGYFPSYALGAFIAAQFHETLRNDLPELDDEIAAGRFGPLIGWLRENVHSVGASLSSQELIANATGRPLSAAPWLRYAEGKYLDEAG